MDEIGDETLNPFIHGVNSHITNIENAAQESTILIRESEAKIVEIIKDLTAKLQ